MPLPTSKHGRKLATRDFSSYLVNALKKKSTEVSERRMDQHTKERFRKAKMTEVKKFVAAEALEALPPEKQPPKQVAMRMR